MKKLNLEEIRLTRYLFFTGKGGVGKTSVACAAAITLADQGKKVLLVSTDPASNLQDVFAMELDDKGMPVEGAPSLIVANLDPVQAAAKYRESVVAPYRGKLPESVIQNMEEQLSGSCTVEIAAFNEFSNFITDEKVEREYDHIIFDTAPTGHTIRMLQLPSAWTGFISENTHGASCLGQLSGLEERKDVYKKAVEILGDGNLTTLILVTRPEKTPLMEAERASGELDALGIRNQILVVNGLLERYDDVLSEKLYRKQQMALADIPAILRKKESFYVPLRAYNVTGLDRIRALLVSDDLDAGRTSVSDADTELPGLRTVVDDLYASGRRVIFTMGKGGVGKSTIAAAIALALTEKGAKVHLATTDPAAHLKYFVDQKQGISMSSIDAEKELHKYQSEVLGKAKETMTADDVAYIEEDLRSPCTQEIAVFRAFANIVEKADDEIVVIDTAPTGHTLLLLDSTQSYHREVERTQGGEIPESVKKLLPRLRSEETEVLIVTLPETTPVYEAMRLEEDLHRAKIASKWWIVNSSFYLSNTENALLKARAEHEIEWIHRVAEHSGGNYAVIPWIEDEIKGGRLSLLL